MPEPKKITPVGGWGIVDPDGNLWPDCECSRNRMLTEAAATFGPRMSWKRLYRDGYRCIRVTLIPSSATMLDALAGIVGVK